MWKLLCAKNIAKLHFSKLVANCCLTSFHLSFVAIFPLPIEVKIGNKCLDFFYGRDLSKKKALNEKLSSPTHQLLRKYNLINYFLPTDLVSDIGWKIGAQKTYFRCFSLRLKIIWKAFTNWNFLCEEEIYKQSWER